VVQSDNKDPSLLALGSAVRHMREQKGISAEQLAQASGVSREHVDALEAGRLDPTYELLLEIADSLKEQPSALVILAERLSTSSGP
jgi:transcriptional regulator with XRE-family HTH domain